MGKRLFQAILEVSAMTLVRWQPAHDWSGLGSDVDRFFDAFFQARGRDSDRFARWVPAMDLVETEDSLVLKADLPGLREDDVTVEVNDNVLTVSGERRAEHERKEDGYHRVERSFGQFSRSVTVPEGIDEDKVTASFNDGVLEVRIPKPEERKPTRISIGRGMLEAGGEES
jgi:HSP20 family protein